MSLIERERELIAAAKAAFASGMRLTRALDAVRLGALDAGSVKVAHDLNDILHERYTERDGYLDLRSKKERR